MERLVIETGRSDAFIYQLLRNSGIDIQSTSHLSEHSNAEDTVFTMDTSPITEEYRTIAVSNIGDATAASGSTLDTRTGNPHAWLLSGSDFQLHAFRTEGEYIASQEVCAVIPVAQESEFEVFGPYEVRIAECEHTAPIAMLLPPTGDATCIICKVRVNHIGERSIVKPLQRRPLSEAARRLASWEKNIQL